MEHTMFDSCTSSILKRAFQVAVLGLLVISGLECIRALPTGMACSSDFQIVMCGQIPLDQVEDRHVCCRMFKPVPLPPAAAAAAQAAALASQDMKARYTKTHRPDLSPVPRADVTNWPYGDCVPSATVDMPMFIGSDVYTTQQTVPQLSSANIAKVKAAAIAAQMDLFTWQYGNLKEVNETSGFIHPGSIAGPAELALMQQRLTRRLQPQSLAKEILLTGAGNAPKYYPGGWSPPTDTPTDYPGPFAMPVIDIKWSGINSLKVQCPQNYPQEAPADLCGHVALVELDAQMVYKQALAYWATKNEQYATNVFRVIEGWADTNKEFGQLDQNGPLEAGWACASMSRALELLKHKAPEGLMSKYLDWMNSVLMPQMDFYADVVTPIALNNSIPNLFGNWHSTVAECNMAFGILTDDRARYDKGVSLFHATVQDYFKWGQGSFAVGRYIGECSETLRDIYHSQFGLGGLLQAAELAWQQNDDLYSSNNYILAAAMELHARIIRAYQGQDLSMLPSGFKLKDDMPPPPDGCIWKFEIRKQLWQAVNVTDYQVVDELRDGNKYLVGITFLPTGWETGYNHFVGRLGMQLPETAALLAGNWPEAYSFHWGLGTLTHANTAGELWTAGLSAGTLCGSQDLSQGPMDLLPSSPSPVPLPAELAIPTPLPSTLQ